MAVLFREGSSQECVCRSRTDRATQLAGFPSTAPALCGVVVELQLPAAVANQLPRRNVTFPQFELSVHCSYGAVVLQGRRLDLKKNLTFRIHIFGGF